MSTDPRDQGLPPLPPHGVFAAPRPHYEPMPLWTAKQVRDYARPLAAEISRLTTSVAERENTVDRLETEVARLTAELEEARKDAGRARSMHPEAVKYVVLSSIGGELISQADVDMRVLNEICRRTGDGMQSLRRVRGALNEMYHLAAAMTKEKP